MRVKDDSAMAESDKYRVVPRGNSRTGLLQSSLGQLGVVTCCVSILCTVAEGRGICRCLRPFSCLVMRLRPVQEVWRCHQERRALVSPGSKERSRGRLQPHPRPLNCPSRHQNRSALIIANRLTAGNHVLLGMWCQRRVVRVGVRGKVSVSRRSMYHVWWSAMSSGFAFGRF